MSSLKDNTDWLLSEFQSLDLEDPRLIDRFFITAQLLASKPSDCIHKACGKWSAVKGAYRLFSNDKVSIEDIFTCHQQETVKRTADHELVFAIQDTTFLDYHKHKKTEGLGTISRPYGDKHKRGLIAHLTFAVTQQALPLGVLTWKCWSRVARPTRTRYEVQLGNIERETKDKESSKWIDALRETHELLKSHNTKIVTLADRESDSYELMHEHIKNGRSFVIRSRVNRRLDKSRRSKPKMHEVINLQDPCGYYEIDVPAKPGKKARKAKLSIRYMKVTTPLRGNIKGGISKNREGLPATIDFNFILAFEENPPSEEERIEWRLMTNEVVSSFNEAVEKVSWYKLRWNIETFFRTLKSGCQIEATRLNEAKKLEKYNVLMSIIAWRICSMTHLSRINSNDPCTRFLSEDQWKVLYCRTKRTNKLPKKPPTCKEATIWIAQLGGFLNRKCDGLPGPMSLWRGWQALEEMTPLYLIMAPALAP
ncbi:MAG: IS4 family transposase [Pseudobdellovibrionaceae bacterium]